MGLNLKGSVVSAVHRSWEASSWQGNERPGGESFTLYVVTGFAEQPIRVRVSPESFSEWTSERQFETVVLPVRASKDRFADYDLAGPISSADAVQLNVV